MTTTGQSFAVYEGEDIAVTLTVAGEDLSGGTVVLKFSDVTVSGTVTYSAPDTTVAFDLAAADTTGSQGSWRLQTVYTAAGGDVSVLSDGTLTVLEAV